jgi:hypothetical protein
MKIYLLFYLFIFLIDAGKFPQRGHITLDGKAMFIEPWCRQFHEPLIRQLLARQQQSRPYACENQPIGAPSAYLGTQATSRSQYPSFSQAQPVSGGQFIQPTSGSQFFHQTGEQFNQPTSGSQVFHQTGGQFNQRAGGGQQFGSSQHYGVGQQGYVVGQQCGASQQYVAGQQFGLGHSYGAGQQFGVGHQYGAGQQFGVGHQYGDGQQFGVGQQYNAGQFSQQRGTVQVTHPENPVTGITNPSLTEVETVHSDTESLRPQMKEKLRIQNKEDGEGSRAEKRKHEKKKVAREKPKKEDLKAGPHIEYVDMERHIIKLLERSMQQLDLGQCKVELLEEKSQMQIIGSNEQQVSDVKTYLLKFKQETNENSITLSEAVAHLLENMPKGKRFLEEMVFQHRKCGVLLERTQLTCASLHMEDVDAFMEDLRAKISKEPKACMVGFT